MSWLDKPWVYPVIVMTVVGVLAYCTDLAMAAFILASFAFLRASNAYTKAESNERRLGERENKSDG